MSSPALRAVALRMLDGAHRQRNEAEHRVWEARDDVTKLRLLFLEAQSREAIAQRELDRAQEFLLMVWTDIKPLAEGTKEVGPDAEAVPQTV